MYDCIIEDTFNFTTLTTILLPPSPIATTSTLKNNLINVSSLVSADVRVPLSVHVCKPGMYVFENNDIFHNYR